MPQKVFKQLIKLNFRDSITLTEWDPLSPDQDMRLGGTYLTLVVDDCPLYYQLTKTVLSLQLYKEKEKTITAWIPLTLT